MTKTTVKTKGKQQNNDIEAAPGSATRNDENQQ
jgi:hypothetical protein